MKKILVFVMMLSVVLTSTAQKKKSTNIGRNTDVAIGAAGVVAGVAAAAYYQHQMREMVEQSAMEWALMSKEYKNGDKLEMKLIEWEVKAITDISSTTNLLFKFKRNDEPYEVILFILSQGWWNENGIVFTKVDPITIDKLFWNDILATLIQVASEGESVKIVNDSLRLKGEFNTDLRGQDGRKLSMKLNETIGFEQLEKIVGRTLHFEKTIQDRSIDITSKLIKIKGDEHIIGILNRDNIILDYNERRINLFNKDTRDLIKLNSMSVNEIHRLIYREPFLLDAL